MRADDGRAEPKSGAQPVLGAVANDEADDQQTHEQQHAQRHGIVAVGAR